MLQGDVVQTTVFHPLAGGGIASAGVDIMHKTATAVRQYKERLGYSEQWMTEYVYNIVLLAKKEPKQKGDIAK
jgi:hypothetical protein